VTNEKTISGPPATRAREISLGDGTVDIGAIVFGDRRGILFRPRPNKIPVGEPGELQSTEYWPTASDVVIWLDETSPAIISEAMTEALASKEG